MEKEEEEEVEDPGIAGSHAVPSDENVFMC